jgi:hypothetical protein
MNFKGITYGTRLNLFLCKMLVRSATFDSCGLPSTHTILVRVSFRSVYVVMLRRCNLQWCGMVLASMLCCAMLCCDKA